MRRCCCGLSGIASSSGRACGWLGRALYAPEPTQDIHCHNGNARSGGNTSERLFCAGLAVAEPVAADHNCDQTRHFRDSSSKETLDGSKAGVEGASLSMSCEGSQDEK